MSRYRLKNLFMNCAAFMAPFLIVGTFGYAGYIYEKYHHRPQLTVPHLNDDISRDFTRDNIGSVALLVIDVQKKYCDLESPRGTIQTEYVADQIRDALPLFRAAGIPVYMVYCDHEFADPDFHKIEPDPARDIYILKNDDSVFDGSDIEDVLKTNGHTRLLVCGVYRKICVRKSVLDGCAQDYEMYVLSDLTGDGLNNLSTSAEDILSNMKKHGARITTSEDALREIEDIRQEEVQKNILSVPHNLNPG